MTEKKNEYAIKNKIFYERRELEDFLSKYNSIGDYLLRCMGTYPDIHAITDPYSKVELTYGQLITGIKETASGLQALGVKKGDFVAVFSENNGLWCMADQGIMRAGGITTARGTGAPTEELRYILEHSEAQYLILQNEKILLKLIPVLKEIQLKAIIMLLNDGKKAEGEIKTPVYTLEELREKGRKHEFKDPGITLEDPSTMLYTSGTTGNPRGVLLTHKNVLTQFPCTDDGFKSQPGEKTLQLLPVWHAYERTSQMYYLTKCCHLHFTTISGFKKDMVDFAPATFMSVPKIWSTIELKVFETLRKKSYPAYLVFRMSIFLSKRYIIHKIYAKRDTNSRLPFTRTVKFMWHKAMKGLLSPVQNLLLKTLYAKIKKAAGLNFRATISGGGSLPMHTQLFFEAIGVTLLEGYGLTETSPVLVLRFVDEENYLGSSGTPVKATEIKIVDPDTHIELPNFTKGLIMARGPQIMKGYYKDDEATKQVIDENGWFNTGDLGWLTSDNHLVIVGREKETIVLSNGENVEPTPIEGACLESPYIAQIVLVGQDEDNLGALVVPSDEALKKCNVEAENLTLRIKPVQNKELHELLKKEIQTHIKNKNNLKSFEYIKQFAVLKDKFTTDNGTMSATGKIKRNKVFEKYKEIIDAMYSKK